MSSMVRPRTQPHSGATRARGRTRITALTTNRFGWTVLCQSHPACQARLADSAADAAASSSCSSAPSTSSSPAPAAPFVLILLNQPLDSFFEALWTHAAFRICADGGANRLYDHYSSAADRRAHLPDCITGDLDSIRPDVLAFYTTDAAASARTLVRRDPDQDSTDLEKCIAWIRRAEARAKSSAPQPLRKDDSQRQQQEPDKDKAACDSNAGASDSSTRLLAPVPTPAVLTAASSAPSVEPSSVLSVPAPSPSPAGLEEWHSAEGSATAHAFFVSSPPLRSLPLLLYPAFGGRFDQQVAMLHAMRKASRWFDDVLMIAEGNSARILMPTASAPDASDDGAHSADDAAAAARSDASSATDASASSLPLLRSMHRLSIHPCLELGHHCGLYPLGAAADCVTTTGLQWNLHAHRMEWGALISTNNIVREREVTVRTDQPLVWTTEMQHQRTLRPEAR